MTLGSIARPTIKQLRAQLYKKQIFEAGLGSYEKRPDFERTIHKLDLLTKELPKDTPMAHNFEVPPTPDQTMSAQKPEIEDRRDYQQKTIDFYTHKKSNF